MKRPHTQSPQGNRTPKAILAAALFVLLCCSYANAQTLARPGWIGSGLVAEKWFSHAIFYEIDARTFAASKSDSLVSDLNGITARLDYVHSLGIDAILLKPIDVLSGCPTTIVTGTKVEKVLCASSGRSPTAEDPPIDPALGTLDEFDDLVLQSSRLKIRILLQLSTPDPAIVRFWLTRGVAGFYLSSHASGDAAALATIRKLLSSSAGQRVLLTDADLVSASTSAKPLPNELILDAATPPAGENPVPALRAAMERSQILLHAATPIFAVDTGAVPDAQLARGFATAAMLNRSATLIVAGQEIGFAPPAGQAALMPWGQPAGAPAEAPNEPAKSAAPAPSSSGNYTPYVPYVRPNASAATKPPPPDPATVAGQDADPKSLLNFYRELARLHHGTTALRDGEQATFPYDDRSALIWVRKPESPSQLNPAVLVACNFSDKPVVLSLRGDVSRLKLRGNFLRTILRSDDLMGGISLDPITLPPFAVYVGSLRF